MDPTNPGMMDAVSAGVTAADAAASSEAEAKAKAAEENVVKALWKEYDEAREFDKEARAQYAVDRRYAAGTANLNWVVTANLIGAFIDILVSFLYARNPDVSVKKSPRVDNLGTQQEDDFAKTLELVVSSMWKAPSAALKKNARAQVRSTLTNGVGWLKAIVVSNGTNIPQLQNELNDVRTNMAQLAEVKARLDAQNEADSMGPLADAMEDRSEGEPEDDAAAAPGLPAVEEDNPYCQMSAEEIDVETARMQELEMSISNRLEVAIRKGMAVDYVSPEDMQVSLDVRCVNDYVNAGWVANAIYRPIDRLGSMFPRLTEEDLKTAKAYQQRKQKDLTNLADQVQLTGMAGGSVNAEEAEQYSAGEKSTGSDSKGFGKVVELWNRETGHVHTMIEGVKRWAKEPYQPDYATTRFYPYFLTAFYPVDGARHPQSLSWRLAKLQDEYSALRSSLRLTRQRAKPGTIFNASGLDPTEAKKLEQSTEQEFIGLKPTNADQPLRDLFTAKPIEVGDMRLYDSSMIMSDMERIAGVQEALQQASTAPKTATEAEIQQTGFASRTTADRDVLEGMLGELAHYTAELAISALDPKDAERIAGPKAFWPHGMAIDDLLTLVEVDIEAGTTGKPKSSGDKDAWGVIMPLIKEAMLQIRQALTMNDQSMAEALTNLLQETLNRMGDDTDVSKFIPKPLPPPPPVPGMPPGVPPGAPGGMPLAAGQPSPDGGALPPGAPADPGIMDPNIQAPPDLAPPDLNAMM